MLAAAAGDTATLGALLDAGAKANARETERGHTALMFAAAANRAARREAAARARRRSGDRDASDGPVGAQPRRLQSRRPHAGQHQRRRLHHDRAGPRPRPPTRRARASRASTASTSSTSWCTRRAAWRRCTSRSARVTPTWRCALIDAGVDVNLLKGGDLASPLLIATVNGHFDLGRHAARSRRQPESRGRERRHAALRRAQPPLGAGSRLSAAVGAPRSEDRLPRLHEDAARQGRRPERCG